MLTIVSYFFDHFAQASSLWIHFKAFSMKGPCKQKLQGFEDDTVTIMEQEKYYNYLLYSVDYKISFTVSHLPDQMDANKKAF